MFEAETKYFEENLPEIAAKYLNKHVVILDKQILGAYNSSGEAYDETVKNYPAGTFMIRPVVSDNIKDYIVRLPFAIFKS